MLTRLRRALRRPCLRSTALASALALLLATTSDAYGLHECAHHEGLPASAASVEDASHGTVPGARHASGAAAGADHGGTAAHGDRAGTLDEAHDAHGAGGAHEPSSHDGACTCIGDCAGATAAAMPSVAGHAHAVEAPLPHPAPSRTSDAPRASHTPHFLPFAQAPPLDPT